MLVVCEIWAGDGDRLLYIDPAVLLSHLGWVTQPWVTEGPKPSVCHWLSIRHLVSNWLEPPRAPGYIIVSRSPASAVLPLIYTGASLDWRLGRGSICYTLNCGALHLFWWSIFQSRIVLTKIRLSVGKNKKQTVKTTSYGLSSLTNRNISKNMYDIQFSSGDMWKILRMTNQIWKLRQSQYESSGRVHTNQTKCQI